MPVPDPEIHRRQSYIIELLETTRTAVDRISARMDQADREDRETLRLILRELTKIEHDLSPPPPPPPPQPLTRSIQIKFAGENQSMAANALVFNVGQTSQVSIQPLLADGVTPSGGTVSNVSYAFSDPSATVVLNSDGLTATATGVAASAGAVSGAASCTVTDTDGAVSTWTQAFTITTNAVAPPPPPSQLTQSVAVEFSTPTP